MDLSKLSAFFPKNDIQFRLGAQTKDKLKGQAFAYISARAIQNRLDEVVGPANWKDNYTMIGANGVLCTLSIKIDGEWIDKHDVSEVDLTQKNGLKGGISDALKRAAVKWGIGRYLYEYEAVWVTLENNRLPKNLALPDEFLIDEEKTKKTKSTSTTPKTESKPVEKKETVKDVFTAKMVEFKAEMDKFSAEDKKLMTTIFEKVIVSQADKADVIAWLEKDAVSGGKITVEAKDWAVAKLKSLA